jgi:phospholipase C
MPQLTMAAIPDGPGSSASNATPSVFTEGKIRHVVILMLENHAFDNYFGVYCPRVGPYCPAAVHGLPAGTCVPEDPSNLTGTCVRPYNFSAANWSINAPLPHGWNNSHTAWNNGSMDGFYKAENSGTVPFGHYNGSTAGLYWDLAEEYGLGDDFFSSTLSYSLPNHWYLLAGQSPAIAETSGLGGERGGAIAEKKLYLSEANNTTSAEDLLLAHPKVSWKYYDYALGTWANASNVSQVVGHNAFAYWNPQAAKYESYTAKLSSHFVPNTDFFTDAAKGQLPNISWVIPYARQSDHPPNNVTSAESYVASVVDAVEASSDWNTTAMFITWDDYGGFYDGVAPPTVNGSVLSFRVPLIVISPYTPSGRVVHHLGYFESLLHFVEVRFGLGCINARDCNAPLLRQYFDFNMTPRPPMKFPTTNIGSVVYPMALQSSTAWVPVDFTAPVNFTNDPNGNGVDVD